MCGKQKMEETEKPLRIALVIPHLGGGGAERSVLQLARGLIEHGHAVDILVFKKINTLADEFPPQARQFILKPGRANNFRDRIRLARRFGFRILRFLRRDLLKDARSVAAYIDEERPDCILPSLPGAKSATLLALCFTEQKPVIIPMMRNVVMNRKRRFRKLYAILFPTADHIITVSDGVADSVALNLESPAKESPESTIRSSPQKSPSWPVPFPIIPGCPTMAPRSYWRRTAGSGQGFSDLAAGVPAGLPESRGPFDYSGRRKLAETPGKHDPQNGTGKKRIPARLGPEPLRLHEPRLGVRTLVQA